MAQAGGGGGWGTGWGGPAFVDGAQRADGSTSGFATSPDSAWDVEHCDDDPRPGGWGLTLDAPWQPRIVYGPPLPPNYPPHQGAPLWGMPPTQTQKRKARGEKDGVAKVQKKARSATL